MVRLDDIYFKVDTELIKNNYWLVDITEKKKLVNEELKKYAISKINELKFEGELSMDMSVEELLSILASLIPKEKHFDTIRHFTHYILEISGHLQRWSITWWGDRDDQDLINNPYVEFDVDGYWDSLITHKDTDLVKTFEFVYHVFTKEFMISNDYETKKLEKNFLNQ